MTGTAQINPRSPASKRGDVLEGARRALIRYGYDRATIALIAVEAGVTRQTVYAHFGSRQVLFEEVAHMACDRLGRRGSELWADVLREDNDFECRLRYLARAMLRDSISEDHMVLRYLAQAGLGRQDAVTDGRNLDWDRSLNQVLTKLITEHAERGALDIPDVGAAIRNLNRIVVGDAVMRWQTVQYLPSAAEIDWVVDSGVEFWLRAYQATSRKLATRESEAAGRHLVNG